MSVPHTILLSWPPVCQKLSNLVNIRGTSDKNKLGHFWTILYKLINSTPSRKATSNLSKAPETRDSLSSSYLQIVLIYLYPFCRNSLLKTVPQPQIAKKPTKTPNYAGSRSFKVINVDTNKKLVLLLVMINSCLCLSATVFTLH